MDTAVQIFAPRYIQFSSIIYLIARISCTDSAPGNRILIIIVEIAGT